MTTFRFGGDRAEGLASLQSQRSGLIRLANGFYRQALVCGTFDAEYDLTSEFLRVFMARIADCFNDEEEMMAECRYPYREEHREEHEAFTAVLYALRRRHKRGGPAMSVEIFQVIREWAESHGDDADDSRDCYLARVVLPAV